MSKEKSFFASLPQTPASARRREETRLCLEATEWILATMERQNVTPSELARRLGCHKSLISQALSGTHNMTLRTLAGFAWALGTRACIQDEEGIPSFALSWAPTPPLRWEPRAGVAPALLPASGLDFAA